MMSFSYLEQTWREGETERGTRDLESRCGEEGSVASHITLLVLLLSSLSLAHTRPTEGRERRNELFLCLHDHLLCI